MINKTISHYKITSLLGEGSMSLVYKATDLKLNRNVALKFMRPDIEIDKKKKRYLIREAQAISALDHPNICTIYEIEETDEGRLFIAIAYYKGKSLKEKILEGPVSENEAVNIIEQIARGLEKAHQSGIIHRDIKPANIMLTEEGLVKIVDFGVAKLIQNLDETVHVSVIGTPTYLSPEQAKKETIDQRCDIWSLGVIFYEMLSGKRPFDKNNNAAQIYSIIFDPVTPLSEFNPDVSPYISKIIQKMLSKNPQERYQNLGELLSDLKKGDEGETTPSVCALPFTDLSPKKDQQHFADGLAEEIINKLTQIKELRVVSRTSAFSFRDKKLDITEIKKRINVQTVLEGSIRVSGERLRVTTKLILVEDESLLWSEEFERQLSDIFAIQDEISLAVVKSLKIKLISKTEIRILKRYTENVNVYTEYLKGRYHWNKRTFKDLKKSITYYHAALADDSNYAPAYVGLADTYTIMGLYGAMEPGKVMPLAISEAKKAVQIDTQLAEAHVSLGCVQAVYEWDWNQAQQEFETGMDLNPGYALAYQWYAVNYLLPLGKFDEANDYISKAHKLDPISRVITMTAGVIHYFQRSYDKAIESYTKTLELDPNFATAHFFLGQTLAQKNQFQEALQHLLKAIQLFGESNNMLATFGYAAALAGKTDHANKALEKLLSLSDQKYVSAHDIALIYVGLGQTKEALKWLNKALEEKAYLMIYLKVDPALDPLRNNREFKKILKKMSFPKD